MDIEYSITEMLIEKLKIRKEEKSKKISILTICWRYLIGDTLYKEAYRDLGKYKMRKPFLHFLRKLDEEDIEYIRVVCRCFIKYLPKKKNLFSFLTSNRSVYKKDARFLNRLRSKIDIKSISIQKYPNVRHVINNMKSTVFNKVNSMFYVFSPDRSIMVDDFISELTCKIVEVYRQYIFSFGTKNFNRKVFFKVLNQSLTSRFLDLRTLINNDQRKVNLCSISLEEFLDGANRDTKINKFNSNSGDVLLYAQI